MDVVSDFSPEGPQLHPQPMVLVLDRVDQALRLSVARELRELADRGGVKLLSEARVSSRPMRRLK